MDQAYKLIVGQLITERGDLAVDHVIDCLHAIKRLPPDLRRAGFAELGRTIRVSIRDFSDMEQIRRHEEFRKELTEMKGENDLHLTVQQADRKRRFAFAIEAIIAQAYEDAERLAELYPQFIARRLPAMLDRLIETLHAMKLPA